MDRTRQNFFWYTNPYFWPYPTHKAGFWP